ncbi:MAG: hypothetical protein P4K80_03120 [Acidobacteriaceae bacterium]|nr:hypothetical protein [Acidobacteriaceae bacterium]
MNSHRNPRPSRPIRAAAVQSTTSARAIAFAALRSIFRTALPSIIVAALLSLSSTLARAADHKAPPPESAASTYPANDAHPDEHLTIAAEPCDEPKKCSFFRLSYIQNGLLPVRVIFTNDGDRALQLDEVRIQFLSAAGDKLPAATEEEINRRLFTLHSTQPIRIPLIPIPIQRTPIDKKITQDDDEFGFHGTIVNAHSTLAGYLFYDIRGIEQPALAHALLYIKQIRTLDGKLELFDFTIPFDKWLTANPNAPSNHPRKQP